jgi:hypothetical protein
MSISKFLESLEQQRAHIAARTAVWGDLRCGSITSTTGRCGKPKIHFVAARSSLSEQLPLSGHLMTPR